MREDLKKEIFRITKTFYDGEGRVKFQKILRFKFFKKDKLRAYIAAKTAVRLAEPLKRSELDHVLKEFQSCLQFKGDTSRFLHIMDKEKRIAELVWSRASLAMVRRKAVFTFKPHSLIGTQYNMEKARRGPVSDSDLQPWREQTKELERLEKQIEDMELDHLQKNDPEEFRSNMQKKEERDEWLAFNSPDQIVEDEMEKVLVLELEDSLQKLLDPGNRNFTER